MAAEVLSFQQEEGKTAYYATFVSDGNPVTIQIKNKGGYVTAFAGIDDLEPVPLYPNASQYNGASNTIFRIAGLSLFGCLCMKKHGSLCRNPKLYLLPSIWERWLARRIRSYRQLCDLRSI